VSDKRLTSPPVAVTGPTKLTFRHNYNLEASSEVAFDAGVLEIAVDDGDFDDVTTVGEFVTGGYIDKPVPDAGNPLGGRTGWTGNSGGFVMTAIDLPGSLAGSDVRFRWRLGTDTTNGLEGWRIDNVKLELRRTLDVTSTNGTVTSSPAGINCGSTCSGAFDDGASVSLTATPDSGFHFTAWSGDCTGTGACNLSMSEDRSVTASFTADIFKPDATINVRNKPTVVGNDVYDDGSTQSVKKTSKKKASYVLTFQNDGNVTDTFEVTGCAPAGTKVNYVEGTADVTAAVLAGVHQVTLTPGAEHVLVLTLSARRGTKTCVTSVASEGGSTTDAVTAILKIKR
jgi:hypothetical protein